MAKAKSSRREFLQLAQVYDPIKHRIGGWWVSEKLDGTRCLWDGGVSRGLKTVDVPYASVVDPKSPVGKFKAKVKPVATGLWSRYGNPIMAPDWFLDQLPKGVILDGELWAGAGNFQLCRSIVAGDLPDARFKQVQYAVYGCPSHGRVFAEGEIKNSNFVCTFNENVGAWWAKHCHAYLAPLPQPLNFRDEYDALYRALDKCEVAYRLHQTELHSSEDRAREQLSDRLDEVLAANGEGIMLRNPDATWKPKRVNSLLKCKPFEDDEATVVGFVAGKAGKADQVRGKIGALVVKWQDKEFELGSGLTMEQRELDGEARLWAHDNPGKRMPLFDKTPHFHVGQVVTFKYRELSDDGIPKEGRYFRERGDE